MNRIASRFTTLLSFRGDAAFVCQVRATWSTGEAAFLLVVDSQMSVLFGNVCDPAPPSPQCTQDHAHSLPYLD